MKKKVSLFILLCFSISFYAQVQRNYAQELVDLLHQEKYFVAREFKSQYADLLPKNDKALDLLYNIHMALAFNKPDSATIYLEEFLNNPDYEQIMGPLKNAYYGRLVLTYENLQQFKQSISAAEKQLSYLERNPFSVDQKFIENETHEVKKKISSLREKLEKEPQRRIVRDFGVQDIKLKDSEYIRFDAKYNGQEIETLLNTDVSSFFIVEEGLANDIGVSLSPNQDGGILANGIIDSIELKGVKLYNIPVTIFKGKFSSVLPSDLDPNIKLEIETKVFKNKQIIMGVSAIQMIGRLEFDWKSKVLRLPSNQMSMNEESVPNFFLLKNIPYLYMKVNEVDFTGFLNTSAKHFLCLTIPYLMSNSDNIATETQEKAFSRAFFLGFNPLVKRHKIKQVNIHFDYKNSNFKDAETYVTTSNETHRSVFDGEVGVDFIKKISSKIFIDFDTMTIKTAD